jgi:hypothetical protein
VEIRPSIPYPSDLRWKSAPIHHYYVTFWDQRHTATQGVDQARIGWREDMHEIQDAPDIVEVVEWAEEEARKRDALFTIFVRMNSADGAGLVWVAGLDPTVAPEHNFATIRPSGATPMAGGTQPYRHP